MSSSSSSDVVVLDDEPEPLQLRERILYKRSPARVKTLDILAKSSSFSSLSLISLKKYCSLAREEGGATSVEQAGAFLEKRYEWNVSTRVDFQEAWNATVPESGEKEAVASASNLKTEKEANDVHPDRVYLSFKKDAFAKCTLLCQIEDHKNVKFAGDSGAVGRIAVKEDSKKITIDLKGQQFEGEIYPGPTVLMVNTTQNPFASKKNSSGAPVQERLKIEAIANEFCDLKFKKDLMSDLIGSYTGDIESMKPTKTTTKSSKTKSKKRKLDEDEDSDVEDKDDESDYDEGASKTKKVKARNPKITTINRKQNKKSTKKRKSTSKK